MQREKARLQQVKLLAPISGLVAVRQNRTGFMFPGMQIPDIREGDQVRPGIPVADVLDLSEMEVLAKVGELDRANLQEGQDATLVLDALPEKKLSGKIKSMSGTASSNTFSFDPAKKFDVVFGIDMKELLAALGAKPEQIKAILATAEQNRKKPVSAAPQGFVMASGGGAPGGGASTGDAGGNQMTGMQGGQGMAGGMGQGGMGQGGEGGQAGGRRSGGGGFGGMRAAMRDMTPEQQQKVQEAIKKAMGGKSPQDMTPEERAAMGAKIQAVIAEVTKQSGAKPADGVRPAGGQPGAPAAGAVPSDGQRGQGRRSGGESAAGGNAAPAAGQSPQMIQFAGGPGGAGSRGQSGPGGMPMGFGMGGGMRYSEKELADAKLPPPPEEDTQFDVLLRPGLLADVEIIVEKIPNAINVPMQAVFEREGKPVVYVKNGSVFEPRIVKPFKRSESVMVIAEGLKPGEVVALADPTAKKSDGKKEKKGDSGGAMGALPGGGK